MSDSWKILSFIFLLLKICDFFIYKIKIVYYQSFRLCLILGNFERKCEGKKIKKKSGRK